MTTAAKIKIFSVIAGFALIIAGIGISYDMYKRHSVASSGPIGYQQPPIPGPTSIRSTAVTNYTEFMLTHDWQCVSNGVRFLATLRRGHVRCELLTDDGHTKRIHEIPFDGDVKMDGNIVMAGARLMQGEEGYAKISFGTIQ